AALFVPLAPEFEEMSCVIVGRFAHHREHFMEARGLGVDIAPNETECLHNQIPFKTLWKDADSMFESPRFREHDARQPCNARLSFAFQHFKRAPHSSQKSVHMHKQI